MGERNEGKERIKCSSTTVQHIPVLMPLLMEELCRGTAEWILHPVVYHSVGPSTCHVHNPLIFPRKHRRWYSGVGGCVRNQFDDQMRWMGILSPNFILKTHINCRNKFYCMFKLIRTWGPCHFADKSKHSTAARSIDHLW